ncbi:hypothetical protein D4N09_19875 [Escherichia coli]|uniref:Uncharacterized protein n=1 Tax=Escherichia coli TaxID=562 RepID=A0A8T9CQC6_ECOLX|nr:hypothetical protein BXO92_20970 [Escherichia coli]EEY6013206.1 hypothetical protein [Escherichia coli]EEY6141617.1 hypothetical protein [Escherichia coli]EFN7708143.1 hypothetical protein [Escherichia coli]EGD7795543.1 hypothetical protein [Escherichia coli]
MRCLTCLNLPGVSCLSGQQYNSSRNLVYTLALFISIHFYTDFFNPLYYRAGCDEQQHIYSRYKIR